MTLKYISVERSNVADNREYKELVESQGMEIDGRDMKPVIFIEFADGRAPITAHSVEIKGESEVVYHPHNFEPGDPNAHVWVQTRSVVWYATEYGGDRDECVL